jgi:hypothetical protein
MTALHPFLGAVGANYGCGKQIRILVVKHRHKVDRLFAAAFGAAGEYVVGVDFGYDIRISETLLYIKHGIIS